METLLVDSAIAKTLLPKVKEAFDKEQTELRGDSVTRESIMIDEATHEDFDTEYLDNILSIKVVEGVEGAMAHIKQYGSGHSEAIVTENYTSGEQFMNGIDAACVYINASTQFTDGGEFGFGAEVGISTNKLHARGPMGINDLTTYKYKIYGNGQVRT
jgi:glutamate-5-semialdehyde dehydrogenase